MNRKFTNKPIIFLFYFFSLTFSVDLSAPIDSDIKLKILLEAGTSSSFLLAHAIKPQIQALPGKVSERANWEDKTRYIFIFNNRYVKKLSFIIQIRGKSAMVHNNVLKNEITNYDAIQRLNAGDLAYPYLVGLIEGDGWFTITKNGKYLKYEFGIEMSIRDIQLLYKLKKLLGVGTIDIRRKNKLISCAKHPKQSGLNNTIDSEPQVETAIFRIRNKTHLKNIVIPIFDKYPLLSNKKYDYLRFKESLLSDTIYSNDLIKYVRPTGLSINSDIVEYTNTEYFQAWLIGFIEAEGCFSIYKPTLDSSKVASFEISQTNGHDLIEAIKIYLNLTSKVYLDKTNNSKLKVSSIRQIANVVKFIKKAPIKLMGYKNLQYLLFIKELRKIPRYSDKIKIPNKY